MWDSYPDLHISRIWFDISRQATDLGSHISLRDGVLPTICGDHIVAAYVT